MLSRPDRWSLQELIFQRRRRRWFSPWIARSRPQHGIISKGEYPLTLADRVRIRAKCIARPKKI